MATHHVTYTGPPALAVEVATRVADAEGVELIGATSPRPLGRPDGAVALGFDVRGQTEAVAAAVDTARLDLPGGATLTFTERGDGA